MCIIVAKPLGGINITTIVNEFIKDVKALSNKKRIKTYFLNFSLFLCKILNMILISA